MREELDGAAVEEARGRLEALVRDRQGLRHGGADRAALEANREAIARAQWDLSRALVARYHPGLQPA